MFSPFAYSQLLVSTAMTPQQWVQNVLVGQGVSTFNITYSGIATASGTFAGNTNLGFNSGVILTTGDVNDAPMNGTGSQTVTNNSTATDADLASTATAATNDMAILEFDFIPQSDTIKFRYVFGSEEYEEWVGSTFNDVFGFFISGPGISGPYSNGGENIALIPNTTTPVMINNVNQNVNTAYYTPNPIGQLIEYDGLTVVLTAKRAVIPCLTYHIKLCIADVGDHAFDSGVFLEENSFSSTSLSVNTSYVSPGNPNMQAELAIEGCRNAIIDYTMPFARQDTQYVKIKDINSGSAIFGVDFTLNNYNPLDSTVMILPYHVSGKMTIVPLYDGIPEGIENFEVRIKTSICATADTVLTIPIHDYVYINMTAKDDTAVCESEVQLWVNPTGGAPPYGIQWSPIETLSNPFSVNPVASPGQTTTYQVIVKDSTRCSVATDSIKVTYNKMPLISFKPSAYKACDSVTVQFTNNTIPFLQNYVWKFGDGDSSLVASPSHTFYYNPSVTGYYVSLQATSPEGCREKYHVDNLITVYPSPVASFTATPDSTSTADSIITFTNNSSFLVNSYWWSFGDPNNSTSTEQNPTFMYDQAGIYPVWLYVNTPFGCKDSISDTIIVVQEVDYLLTVPNIITPNGDGKNDQFKITNLENFAMSELAIYNRWGKKIYEASPYRNNWDGENAPDGVYFFVLRYKKKKSELKLDGSLTIMR